MLNQIEASFPALGRLADISDETVADVTEARRAHNDASEAVVVARAVFDLISAERANLCAWPEAPNDLVTAAAEVATLIADLRPIHFPAAFPEVFARPRPGFDCILGNPPWDEVTVEELGFWALHFPGLKSKRPKQRAEAIAQYRNQRPDLYLEYESAVTQAERLRDLLRAGPYPGMGVGDPDLYKAFCWRFWHLLRDGGRMGVVLPREALAVKGSTEWRKTVLSEGTFEDVTTLLNNRGWVFDDVDPRYTVGLCSLCKGPDADAISISGPFGSEDAYEKRVSGIKVEPSEFRSWSKTAAFRWCRSPEALGVFQQVQGAPASRLEVQPATPSLTGEGT